MLGMCKEGLEGRSDVRGSVRRLPDEFRPGQRMSSDPLIPIIEEDLA